MNSPRVDTKEKKNKMGFLVGAFFGCAIFVFAGCQKPLYALQASYYTYASLKAEGTWKHGERRMANGQRYDETKLTCATRLYPLGTYLKITNNANGKSIVVKVTDRIGKRFATKRIDLSYEAMRRLDGCKSGLVPITVEVVKWII